MKKMIVEREGDHWVAIYLDLAIMAEGPTKQKAIEACNTKIKAFHAWELNERNCVKINKK